MNLPFTIRSSSRTAIAAAAVSLLFALPLAARALPVMPAPQVQLADGTLAGDRAMTGIHQLNVFRGIPYAAPPVGPLADHWQLTLGLAIIAFVALLPKGIIGIAARISPRGAA